MQQLSLFDFGEEAPKPEKKNKASKSGIERSESPDNGNTSEGKAETINDTKKVNGPGSDEKAEATPSVGDENTSESGSALSLHPSDEDLEKTKVTIDPERVQTDTTQPATNHIIGTEAHEINQPDRLEKPASPDLRTISGESTISAPTSSFNGEADTTETKQVAQQENSQKISEDVIFSNEQVRVKNYVVKSPETSSFKEPQMPLDEGVETNGEANAKKTPDLDTSFSPDEFQSQEFNQDMLAGEVENIVDKNSVIDNEINHFEPNEDPETDKKSQANNEHTDNQPDRSDNSARKPFYIEDQTVPVRKRGRKSFKEIDAEVDLINVPSDEELFQKQYYPISVVAKWFRVNNSLLRFWENEFKILKPRKNKKGDRFFRPEDVKNLQLIYYLLRQKKLTINGAIKHLKSYKEQTEVNMQLIQTLNDFKGFLLELKAATEK